MESPHNLATRSHRGNSIQLQVKSLTREGVTYLVRYINRKWECNCPSVRYQKGPCKHVMILSVLGPKRVTGLAAIEGRSR